MNALLFLKNGFEEVEALTTVNLLRRAGINLQIISCENTLTVKGAHHIVVVADDLLDDIIANNQTAEMAIIPGGPHVIELIEDNKLVNFMLSNLNKFKYLAAICAGPLFLQKINCLENHEFTCYPSLKNEFYQGKYVEKNSVISQNIITAAGPYSAVEFSCDIIKTVLSPEILATVAAKFLVPSFK